MSAYFSVVNDGTYGGGCREMEDGASSFDKILIESAPGNM